MSDQIIQKGLEILSQKELNRTIKRLASQILEKVPDTRSLLLVGIPTRGVYLSKLLAIYLEELSGQIVENGCLDPTFHRDDLSRVGTRIAPATELLASEFNSLTTSFFASILSGISYSFNSFSIFF